LNEVKVRSLKGKVGELDENQETLGTGTGKYWNQTVCDAGVLYHLDNLLGKNGDTLQIIPRYVSPAMSVVTRIEGFQMPCRGCHTGIPGGEQLGSTY
jgi:hypothetical protein